MKKLLNLLTLIGSLTVLSQSVYYDAVQLKSNISTGKFQSLPAGGFCNANAADSRCLGFAILKKYAPSDLTTDQQILNYYMDNNPFIEPYINMPVTVATPNVAGSSQLVSGTLSSGQGLGGNIAIGIADFLIKQGKKELNEFFFIRFQAALEKQEMLRVLFPETHKKLELIGKDIYQFKKFINSLRDSFEADYNQLLINFPKLRNIDRANLKKMFKDSEEAVEIFMSSLEIMESSLQIMESIKDSAEKKHPGRILSDIDSLINKDENYSNYSSSIKLLNVISQSLRESKDVTNERYWVSIDPNFVSNMSDVDILQLYLGLLYERIPDNVQIGNKSIKTVLKEFAPKFISSRSDLANARSDAGKIKTFIIGFGQKIKALEDIIEANRNTTLTNSSLAEYWIGINNLLKGIKELEQIDSVNIDFGEKYDQFIIQSNSLLELVKLFNKNKYVDLALSITRLLESYGVKPKVTEKFKLYGVFTANILEADDSETVTAVLESISDNSGGSSEKRNARFNISINGYIGLDFLTDSDENRFGRINGHFGITAPVGIAVSTSSKNGWSFTAFASVIDVGGIAQYRLQETDNTIEAEIKLANIISPGLNGVIGFPKSPFSLGAGWQAAPTLRTIDPNNITTTSVNDYKFHIFLAIDIPVINLYSSH